VQDIWANLLANAAGPYGDDEVTPSFPTILMELRARDVKFLDALFREATSKLRTTAGVRNIEKIKFSKVDLYIVYSGAGLAKFPVFQTSPHAEGDDPEDFREDASDMDLSLDTFERNRVFVKVYEVPIRKGNTNTFGLGTNYSFTHLGACFVKACRDPRSREK